MKLEKFTTIKSGRMFRTAIKGVSNGSFRVVQTRDVLVKNGKPFIDWSSLARINIESNRKVNCLQSGQLLVVAKGPEKHIIRLDDVPDNVVCTQHFLSIEVKKEKALAIEFVEFILSSDISKKWLASRAGGNYQSILSKSTLEQLPFPDLTIALQNKAIALKQSIEKEQTLIESLMKARYNQKNKLISKWLNEGDSDDQ
jgi:restriction endonuclease S subunit